MPVYEFVCDGCGPFETRRTFEESRDPMPCPDCGTVARRRYSAPAVSKTPTALSNAVNRADKSAHEPEVVSRPAGGEASSDKKLRKGHGRPWSLGH